MKISTRSRYGLRASIELALNYGKGPLMMQTIAKKQSISRKYLDTIFTSLKNAGLIRSRRGVGGGHRLVRDPNSIKLGELFKALEGPILLVDCVEDMSICEEANSCVTRELWIEVCQAIEQALNKYTLADLMQKHLDQNNDKHLLSELSNHCPRQSENEDTP